MYSHLGLDIAFVAAVTVIWFMIGYQVLLFFFAHRYYWRSRGSGPVAPSVDGAELPGVSVLVPCHNEELVIAGTIEALRALDYTGPQEFLIIDDGSTDRTAEIVRSFSADPRIRLLQVPPERAGRGKALALNAALTSARHPILAVYDADNRPQPGALRPLVEALVRDDRLGAAIGMYRVINRHRNLLTRFLNIEGIAYQWIVQAGRWAVMRFAALPGTNYVIRRSLVESLGGWDPAALTEDAEMTLRIYEAGYCVKFVPTSVSWEQEPETIRTWLRQRHRWVRGHNHLVKAHLRTLFRIRPRTIGLELVYSLCLYYAFFMAIVVSDLFFLFGMLGLLRITVTGPYAAVWLFAGLLFFLEILVVLAYEQEAGPFNALLVLAMYFTYCQLWIPVAGWALWDDVVLRRPIKWAKTRRFQVEATERA